MSGFTPQQRQELQEIITNELSTTNGKVDKLEKRMDFTVQYLMNFLEEFRAYREENDEKHRKVMAMLKNGFGIQAEKEEEKVFAEYEVTILEEKVNDHEIRITTLESKKK